jgi:hypothetical protein
LGNHRLSCACCVLANVNDLRSYAVEKGELKSGSMNVPKCTEYNYVTLLMAAQWEISARTFAAHARWFDAIGIRALKSASLACSCIHLQQQARHHLCGGWASFASSQVLPELNCVKTDILSIH